MSKDSIFAFGRFLLFHTFVSAPPLYGAHASFSFGLYVIFRSLDGSPESANLPFLRPFYEKLSQASQISGLPSERKKTSSDFELPTVQRSSGWNGCLKPPCYAAHFSKRRLKRLPALWGSDGRWFVWTLHLFRLIQQFVVGLLWRFWEQVLAQRKSMNFLILSKGSPPKNIGI